MEWYFALQPILCTETRMWLVSHYRRRDTVDGCENHFAPPKKPWNDDYENTKRCGFNHRFLSWCRLRPSTVGQSVCHQFTAPCIVTPRLNVHHLCISHIHHSTHQVLEQAEKGLACVPRGCVIFTGTPFWLVLKENQQENHHVA